MENSAKLVLQSIHSNKAIDEMFLRQLKKFLDSEKCCMTYPKFYNTDFRQKIIDLIKKFSKTVGTVIKYRVHEYSGLKFLKIYKETCNSYIHDNIEFIIPQNSKKVICKYLYESSLTLKEQVELYPGVQKSDILCRPRIQIYHFSMNRQSNTTTIPAMPKLKYSDEPSQNPHLSLNHYRDRILQTVQKNQVTVITYDIGIDKLGIPQILLENSSTNNEHCRMVYSNNQKFVAIENSHTIAKRRGELIGITVGYQIPLKSVSSFNKTNLLFTSTSYFLRCLMGVNSKDVFYGITHVILDDVQERDFQLDLMLFEIREVLSFYPNLKILLLCSNPFNIKPFEEYFKNVNYLNLRLNFPHDSNVQIHYLNRVLKMLNYLTPEMKLYLKLSYNNKKITLDDKESQLMINNLIDRYVNETDTEVFDKFCYLVQVEHIPVDVQHSESLINMLMGAAKNNNVDHLKILLKMSSNIYLKDNENRTAQDWARNSSSLQTLSEILKILDSRIADEKFPEDVQRLKAYCFTRANNFEVDHLLVFELLKFLHESSKNGAILIITPSYDDILKIQYFLERYFKHILTEDYIIFKLHNNNKMSEIDEITKISSRKFKRQFIFSTEIVESFLVLNNILYVVDTGLIKLSNHAIGMPKVQWISKDRAERRKAMAAFYEAFNGVCFRLYTCHDFSNFSQVITPELMHMPLDNVSLFVKILSPYTSIKDYFMRTICSPSNGQIEKSIGLLKTIGALEEQESLTILGMRLIDIPLPVQLGKVLIYGIFLQCLDPVLTIISLLQFNDHFIMSDSDNRNNSLYLCKENFAENSNSDHLTFLRIFQKWQDDRLESVFEPNSLELFLFDQNLQVVCEIRSEIVGTVRSAQLIHANGLLSMNFINSFANNWAMVKACFLAGMYPNICHIEKDHSTSDLSETQFKCNSAECIRKIFLYPGSVLRNKAPDSWNKKSINYQTDWVFYQNVIHREKICRILNSTIITPITIAIFAGNLKKSESEFFNGKMWEKNSTESKDIDDKNQFGCMIIDDWISFKTSKEDACLIFHLRQKFSHIFLDLLQNCDNYEKFQKCRTQYMEKLKILETLSNLLQNEDLNFNFPQLERIGERPKALPVSCVSDMGIANELNSHDTDARSETKILKNIDSFTNNKKKSDSISNINENQADVMTNCKTYQTSPLVMSINKERNNVTHSNFLFNNMTKFSTSSNQNFQNFVPSIEVQPNSLHFATNEVTQLLLPKIITDRSHNYRKNEVSKYASPETMKFYILPCINRNDAFEYISQNKFNKNCLPLWNEMCLKFIENTTVIHYVFLFNIEESCFCYLGRITWNGTLDGIRLREVFAVNFTLDHVIARLKHEHRYVSNFVNYVNFGEINFQFGYDLMYCIEIFEKINLEND